MIDDRVSIRGKGKNKHVMIIDWSIVDEFKRKNIRCKIIIKNDNLIVYAPIGHDNIGFSTYYNTEVNKLYIGGDDASDCVNIPLKVDVNSGGCKLWKLGNI